MKKFISLLSIILLFFTCTISGQTTVSIPDTTVAENVEVLLPVKSGALAEVGSFSLNIAFDTTAVEYKGIENNVFTTGTFIVNDTTDAGVLYIGWFGTDAVEVTDKLFDLKFQYKSGSSAVQFTGSNEITDLNNIPYTVNFVNGSVGSVPAALGLGEVTGESGDTVKVPFNAVNLEGIGSMGFYINYDTAAVEYVGLTDDIVGFTATPMETADGQVILTWISITGTPFTLEEGVLVNLNFVIKAGTTDLTFVAPTEITDTENNVLALVPTNGKITEDVPPALVPSLILGKVLANLGSDVVVPMNAVAIEDLASFTMTIAFDTAVVSFVEVQNVAAGTLVANAENGILNLAWFDTTPYAETEGKFADLVFNYKSGTSALDLEAAQITDINGASLAITLVDGSVMLNPNVAPVITAPESMSFVEGANVLVPLTTSDINSDVLTVTAIEDLPEGSSISPTALFINNAGVSAGSYTFTLVVSDGMATDTAVTTVNVTEYMAPKAIDYWKKTVSFGMSGQSVQYSAVDGEGKVWATNYGVPGEVGLYVFNSDTTQASFSPITTGLNENGEVIELSQVGGVAYSDGVIYAISYATKTVVKYNAADGTPLNGWTLAFSPGDLDIDVSGNIYVGNKVAAMFSVFNSEGIEYKGSPVGVAGWHINRGLSVTRDGSKVFLADESSDKIAMFEGGIVSSDSCAFVAGEDFKNSGLTDPKACEIDPFGRMWISDYGNNRVLIYGLDKTLIQEISITNPDGAAFDYENGLAYINHFGGDNMISQFIASYPDAELPLIEAATDGTLDQEWTSNALGGDITLTVVDSTASAWGSHIVRYDDAGYTGLALIKKTFEESYTVSSDIYLEGEVSETFPLYTGIAIKSAVDELKYYRFIYRNSSTDMGQLKLQGYDGASWHISKTWNVGTEIDQLETGWHNFKVAVDGSKLYVYMDNQLLAGSPIQLTEAEAFLTKGMPGIYVYNTANGYVDFDNFTVAENKQLEYSIADVQTPADSTGDSQLKGEYVITGGIVTAVELDGDGNVKQYFIQDAPGAWNGVLVYDQSTVAVGDSLYFQGMVDEYYDKTELKLVSGLRIVASGIALPEAVALANTADVNNEMYEGVLVSIQSAQCIEGNNNYGEAKFDDGSGSVMTDDLLTDAFPFVVDEFYDIIGVVDYSFNNFKILYRSGEGSDITDINDQDESETLPVEFALDQNYPNPFNPTTNIKFALKVDSKVTLSIYNVLGEQVANLVNEDMAVGVKTVNFNAISLSSGIYFYRLEARGNDGSNFIDVKKMTLLK
ncbi:MAG: T9SS type A sorting domain-containing protein [Melioribacteraceae bacterium]|nr:T9SS type A sorting domain-containing protein [Melioribacteraceae bacterium]